MKILCTLFIIMCMSTQSNANNFVIKLDCDLKDKNITNQQENSYDAYVLQGSWIKGVVYVSSGYVTKMVFNRQSYSFKVKPTALNPNNPMAIEYNFTHYVDVPNIGRAYFILN
jgi:hypothetical protein